MKHLSWLIVTVALLSACSGTNKLSRVDINNREDDISDSVEYELIILDPGFESWFLIHSRPDWYHSQSYYETWNLQYVTAWNAKVMTPRYSRFFETTIGYEPFTDYGLELNHKLFYYFQYVERELKIPVLPQGMGPHSAL